MKHNYVADDLSWDKYIYSDTSANRARPEVTSLHRQRSSTVLNMPVTTINNTNRYNNISYKLNLAEIVCFKFEGVVETL